LDAKNLDVMTDVNRDHQTSAPDDLFQNVVDVSRDHRMNDLHLGEMTDVSRDPRRNVLGDLNDLNLDVSHDRHMNALGDLNDLNLDVSHDRHKNDLHSDAKNLDVMTDVSRDHQTSELDDLNLNAVDVNPCHQTSELDDPNDQNLDGNRGRRMNGLHLDAKNLDAMTDVSRDHRMNGLHLVVMNLDAKNRDVNQHFPHVSHKCARRARNDLSSDAKMTDGLNMNCDQLNRDHLQCDHQK